MTHDGGAASVARSFVEASRTYLAHEYPRKISIAVRRLSDDDLWWRPNAGSNSVGNLILHLAGNTRQWIIHGLGGAPDTRDRAGEFERAAGGDVREVMAILETTVAEADAVLERLSAEALLASHTIQGLEVTGVSALYHVVEHFSMHTGQILYIAKMRSGHDLGFYEVDESGKVTGTRW